MKSSDIKEYFFQIDRSETELIRQIEDLSATVRSGKLFSYRGVQGLQWDPHLYAPVITINGNAMIEVSPIQLNQGEWDFINDLKKFHQTSPGFFEAGNFYPNFIVWLLVGDTQYPMAL